MKYRQVLATLCVIDLSCCCGNVSYDWSSIDLPRRHVSYFFNNNPDIEKLCHYDENCPFKEAIGQHACWGYEDNCPDDTWTNQQNCPDDSEGWTETKDQQNDIFWRESDFGIVAAMKAHIRTICVPLLEHDSKLECSTKTRFCRAKNLYLNLGGDKFVDDEMYHTDFLQNGDIGGHCQLDKETLLQQLDITETYLREDGHLQSWIQQLKMYTSLSFQPTEDNSNCDRVINKPTIFLKHSYMSARNMFHRFGDFISLYVTQHINNTFSTDIKIVIWDEGDVEPDKDLFEQTFKVFTRHPVIYLRDLKGQRVCFKDVIFVPPRILSGMIPNKDLIPGCYGSNMVEAFREHVLHRLGIIEEPPHIKKVKVTLLSRVTQYRNIINKEELFEALVQMDNVAATFAEFEFETFERQLQISSGSDVLIGIHGAGLTHTLFQPDWAVLIELHNCSSSCFNNIARLRGVGYLTFKNNQHYKQHIKCTDASSGSSPAIQPQCEDDTQTNLERQSDFYFDKQAFIELVNQAVNYVLTHPGYLQQQRHILKDEL